MGQSLTIFSTEASSARWRSSDRWIFSSMVVVPEPAPELLLCVDPPPMIVVPEPEPLLG